jgi:hypothetical protein
MHHTNKKSFDTQNLLNKVDYVIQKGLNKILKDFIDNYELYEETYNGVLNLSAVKKLNNITGINPNSCNCNNDDMDMDICDSDSESYVKDIGNNMDDYVRPQLIEVIGNITKEYMESEVKSLEKMILNNFQTFTASNNIMIQKMLLHVDSLREEIKEIRKELNDKKQIIDLSNCDDEGEEEICKSYSNHVTIKEEKEEKENIILNIDETEEVKQEEQNVDDGSNEEQEESDEEEQEEEESDEEEQEEEESEEEEQEEEESEEEEQEEEEQEDVVIADPVVKPEPKEEKQDVLQDEPVKENQEQENQEQENQEQENQEQENQEQENQEEQLDTEAEAESEDEEEEFFEVEIGDKSYCTSDELSGYIYELTEDGDVGDKVGIYKNGVATFYN